MAEAKWYVVHTYSGYENKVKANIEKTIENNKELAELNFTQKTKRVHEIYYEEFWKDILKQLEACVKQAEAINDKYEGTTDRRTARILSELKPLLVGVEKQWEPEQTAEYILRDMCRIFRD